MNEYIINDQGFCENPDVEKVYDHEDYFIYVKYACHNDMWAFGVEIQHRLPKIGIGGWGFNPSFNGFNEEFLNLDDCKKGAFKSILEYLEDLGINDRKKIIAPLINAVKAHFLVIQLSLFN